MSRLLAAVRGWRGVAGQRILRNDSVPLGPANSGAAALPGVIAGRCGGWEGYGVTGAVGAEATAVREIKRRFGKLPNAFIVLLYLTPVVLSCGEILGSSLCRKRCWKNFHFLRFSL